MAKRPTLSQWVKKAEQATRQRQIDDIDEAVRVFQTELSLSEQLALIEEQVKTRSVELCRAYKNVVDVYFGFRNKRAKRARKKPRNQIVREPCVTFVVKKKWARNARVESDEVLPKHLFAYWTVAGRRKLCAIPTDVDDASDYAQIRPDADVHQIEVVDSVHGVKGPGAITCAIQRSLFPEKTYMVSCRHVFSLSKKLHPTEIPGADVQDKDAQGQAVGKTLSITGHLGNSGTSLDAQLAEMTDSEQLEKALGNVKLSGFARSHDDVPKDREYFVLTPDGAISAEFFKVGHPAIDYGMPGIDDVKHRELIISKLSSPTKGGHSGSPITTRNDGGLLIGMHIGSKQTPDGSRASVSIPAWDFMSAEHFDGADPSERWTVLQNESLEAEQPDPTVQPVPVIRETPEFLAELIINHGFKNSVLWRLAKDGIRIADAAPEVTVGEPQTVGRVWNEFGTEVRKWAEHFSVPVELIVATICTESSGKPHAARHEPGYVSDERTPHRVSIGLMQTLISTARDTLPGEPIDRTWLLVPGNSIKAGTAYIAKQRRVTFFDPPKVACAYNAGSLRWNDSPNNRWKMRQFPIGTSEHADRFGKWFNDCFRLFDQSGSAPPNSYFDLLTGQ